MVLMIDHRIDRYDDLEIRHANALQLLHCIVRPKGRRSPCQKTYVDIKRTRANSIIPSSLLSFRLVVSIEYWENPFLYRIICRQYQSALLYLACSDRERKRQMQQTNPSVCRRPSMYTLSSSAKRTSVYVRKSKFLSTQIDGISLW